MATTVDLTWGNLPPGYCFPDPETYKNDIFDLLMAQIAGNLNTFNYGNSVPSPSNQDKPWLRLNPDGTPDGWYVFMGRWLRPHPISASSGFRRIFRGAESSLWSEDGGDGTDPSSNPPTATTGAMWVRDTDFGSDDGTKCFRVPVGIGKNPTTYDSNPATQIAHGDQSGVERVALDATNTPAHRHLVANNDTGNPDSPGLTGDNQIVHFASNGSSASTEYTLSGSATEATLGRTSSIGGDLSHNNMPPYLGVIFAKRSARSFYSI